MTPKQANQLAADLLQWASGGDALQVVGSMLFAATMRGELPILDAYEMGAAIVALVNTKDADAIALANRLNNYAIGGD